MESNFDNRDFEQFVKQNADQYRMFPSEKVWKGVYNTLHTRRRWFGIGVSLLLLTMGSVTWVMLSTPEKNHTDFTKSTNSSQLSTDIKSEDQKPIIEISNNIQPVNTKIYVAGIKSWGNPAENLSSKEIIESPVFNQKTTNEKTPVSNSFASLKIITPAEINNTIILSPASINYAGIVYDDNLDFFQVNGKKEIEQENSIQKIKEIYPLSIESIINTFKSSVNKKKWLWQVYFAPTISYRKLVENKSLINTAQLTPLNYSAVYDINSVVTHKPDMGFELGVSAGYPLSKNVRLTTGLQFNVSKYDIRAYNYYPTEFATVALNTGSGSRSSLSTATNYRNFDGYQTNWLHNLYLSASLPIGVELKLSGDTKNYIGIGGTLQPTYILGDRAYMISSDYKNYVEIPQLIRKWNVSSSFQAFAGYSTGKINWKVGPQVRYQLLSSFQKKYPVKEHVFDFGLKVGIMINQ